MTRLFAVSVLFETSVLSMACGGSTSDDRPGPDAAPLDATLDGATSDTALDDGAPDGPRVRMLIDVPFMEGSPIDNRFLDPQLSLEAGGTWFEYDSTGSTDPVTIHKRVLARAPAGQTAIYVPGKTDNPHGVSVVTGVKLASGTHEGSIWIGTTGTVTLRASVLALAPATAGKGGAFDFAPDLASARDVDGIRWTQYTIALPKGAVGWGFLLVTARGAGGTYLHAPVMRSTGSTTPRLVGTLGRPPTRLELSLVRRALSDQAQVDRPTTASPAAFP